MQAHGILIAIRPADLVISQVNENSAQWLGRAPEQILNQPLGAVLGEDFAAAARRTIDNEPIERTPLFVRAVTPIDGKLAMDACLHTHAGVGFLELEPTPAPDSGPGSLPPDFYSLVRKSLSRFQAAIRLRELAQVVTEEIQRETGLDRVMVYYFHAEESGEVIAETKRADLNSWIGWRYPSHDIPKPAREIFRKI